MQILVNLLDNTRHTFPGGGEPFFDNLHPDL